MRFERSGLFVSYGLALGAGWILWPPGAVYWEGLAAVIGDGPTLVLVGSLALGLGGAVRWVTHATYPTFFAGAVGAYLTGMAVIERTFVPDSPVHRLWYLGLLACFLGGGLLLTARAWVQGGIPGRRRA